MFQGTGSSVGKSLLVAGLCRAALRRGLQVRPFKPQNMSNNAAVTPDGGEIGRAQALQARAAGLPPSVHMNPILLKPQSETGSQLIVQGQVHGTAKARAYQSLKPTLMAHVLDSFHRIGLGADLILVEGAGSASEINLRQGDIANMGFARATSTPVILIGDIDRGGVIASLVGTHTVLAPDDRATIAGFIVNKMRGDLTLFDAGMALIAAHTTWPALGLIPHFPGATTLPAEDAADLHPTTPTGQGLRIAVPLLPAIANFDDLDPLRQEPGIDLILLRPPTPIPVCDVILLPGSKATIADLAALRATGWDTDIQAHARRGGHILGLCGGYQMLGRTIADPHGIEGPPSTVPGLNLLDVETTLEGPKRLATVRGYDPTGTPFIGYEMHMGRTQGPDTVRPLFHLPTHKDGAQTPSTQVAGTYIHGLFTNDHQRAAWLTRWGAASSTHQHETTVEAALDALAAHLETHIDVAHLFSLAR